MVHRLSPRAEADLDDIWLYVAQESRSIEIANRLIDSITERFFLLARSPFIGRSRAHDFGPGCRSSNVSDYVIVYCIEDEHLAVLRVVHGRRNQQALSIQ